jgi:mono/diheme cytochrome c family protein
MSVFRGSGSLWLLVCAISVPMALAAQDSPGTRNRPGVPQTDQQRSGEALFIQNCTLCHVFSNQKRSIGIQASTELVGLFKKPTISDAGVRQLISDGIPKRMPSFKHNFEAREVDDLMAYLKIR